MTDSFEIFLQTAPGLEPYLAEEARELGFPTPAVVPGGVTFQGTWPDIWRANLSLRGAGRVLARIGGFPAFHLAQLDKRVRKFTFGDVLRHDTPVKVEVSSKKSKIYHAGAAKERVERGLSEAHGITASSDAPVTLLVRIQNNFVSFSVDTSGDLLHKRGFKEAVGKAPMRETLAALFLRACGYSGHEPVVDPMCGSGTFVIEAAEVAMNLQPGRAREFAFERLATFDESAWQNMKAATRPSETHHRYYGSDRDTGAIRNAMKNAARAGVEVCTNFHHAPISDLERPAGPAGLVIINPPYGGRIGQEKLLYALYGTMGKTLKERFGGWRVGVITNQPKLAYATGLPFDPPGPPIAHGGLRVKLYKTAALP